MKRNRALDETKERFLSGIGVPERSEFIVDRFQSEAIDSLAQGNDTLVVAPTGSGKTYIAMQAIASTLALGGRAIYTTPLKALSNTKFTEFKKRFEPEYSVGLLTGDRKIEGDSKLVVATTEIFRNELYQYSERYSLVVLDEVHFIADPQRGPVWEESIVLAPSSSALLMLSASISNAEEIAEWLEEVRGRECRVITETNRPVELRFGFIHPNLGILPLFAPDGRVFREVVEYYGSSGLDDRGLRVDEGGRRGNRHQRGRGRRRRK